MPFKVFFGNPPTGTPPVVVSSKRLFEPGLFAPALFKPGLFRGLGAPVTPPSPPSTIPIAGAGGGGFPLFPGTAGRRRYRPEVARSWCRLFTPALRIIPDERPLPPVPGVEALPEAERWPAMPPVLEGMTPAPQTIFLYPTPLVAEWYGPWWRAWEIERRVQQTMIRGV